MAANQDHSIREHVLSLLNGGNAHTTFDDAIAGLPPTAAAWNKSVKSFRADLKALEQLVSDPKTDLYAQIPWGQGQTVLREALLVADHNSYHIGGFVLLRRLLGTWPAK